jgi:glucose-6-phosphate 1-epimerase
VQEQDMLQIAGEIDRLYAGPATPVTLQDGSHCIVAHQSGFEDTVIWNPGVEKARLLADLDSDASSSFLCVEAAAVEHPAMLGPYGKWNGKQMLQST